MQLLCQPAIAGWGWLRLHACPRPNLDLGRTPNFLGQKYPARSFAAETLLDFSGGRLGEVAGLAIVGGSGYAALAIRIAPTGAECVLLQEKSPASGLPTRIIEWSVSIRG
jgi:hypothetical protein